MKRAFWLALILGLLLVGLCPTALQAAPPPPTTHLVMEDGQIVGDVYVAMDAQYLTLEIRVTEPAACLVEITYDLAYSFDELPVTGSGSPQLSQFEYQEDLACATFFYRWIPLEAMPDAGSGLYLAVEGITPVGEVWAAGFDFLGRKWGEYLVIPLGPDPTS